MRILSLLILFAALFFSGRLVDSPHGAEFKISCNTCHSAAGWELDRSIYAFDHNKTKLPLTGQHTDAGCRQCHPTLVFSEAETECYQCHKDVHESTVGSDCSRCHTSLSWLVSNITEIHSLGRFPLVGAHRTAECFECHKSESMVRFDVAGIECFDCHSQQYQATTSPNHIQAGFSRDCAECHPVNAEQWTGTGFNHSFFRLTQGHSISCNECHTDGNYGGLNTDCNSCHQDEFLAVKEPDHVSSGFPTSCQFCHTLAPGWKPASYRQHDSESFPIYSGKHEGEWNSCSECHTNSSNFSQFSCTDCHEHNKADMDNEHQGEVKGYSYVSSECYRCHPNGNSD